MQMNAFIDSGKIVSAINFMSECNITLHTNLFNTADEHVYH